MAGLRFDEDGGGGAAIPTGVEQGDIHEGVAVDDAGEGELRGCAADAGDRTDDVYQEIVELRQVMHEADDAQIGTFAQHVDP